VSTPGAGDAEGGDGRSGASVPDPPHRPDPFHAFDGVVPYTTFEAELGRQPDLFVGDDPIPGWRANNVMVDASRRRAWLVGVHHQRRYGVHATAVCDVEDHAAPASGCHCGLHAWPNREGAEAYRRQWGQQALCRVELEGEVICHGEPGTEDIEGYRASHMTTLGLEFADRCWRCGRQAVALAPVQDGQNRMRVAYGQPEGLADLRPVCDGCRRPDALTCADVASLLGTEVRLAPVELVGTGLMARVQDTFTRGPTAFLLSAAVLLAVAVFGMLGAVVEGSWLTGLFFAATTVGAIVGGIMLATGRGGRRLGVAIAVVTVSFLVVGPVLATVSQTTAGLPSRAEAVLSALEGPVPADAGDLEDRLRDSGASSVRVADIDDGHRAVSFVVGGRCFQTGLATESVIREEARTDPGSSADAGAAVPAEGSEEPDGVADPAIVAEVEATDDVAWLAIGTQSTGIAVGGECPPAYPVLGSAGASIAAPNR
jgi:hypothetical protein